MTLISNYIAFIFGYLCEPFEFNIIYFMPNRSVQTNTLEFLGLTDDWAETHQNKWTSQRLRLADRQCNDEVAVQIIEQHQAKEKALKKLVQRYQRQQSAQQEKTARDASQDQTDVS